MFRLAAILSLYHVVVTRDSVLPLNTIVTESPSATTKLAVRTRMSEGEAAEKHSKLY